LVTRTSSASSLQRCYERREIVIDAFFDRADAIVALRSPPGGDPAWLMPSRVLHLCGDGLLVRLSCKDLIDYARSLIDYARIIDDSITSVQDL
jgi:hypothetical protein